MELVHDDVPHIQRVARPQRLVGEDLGRAADDRSVAIDGAVAGDHADVLGAEDVDQLEELLAHERLDRCRVVAAASLGERDRVGGDGDEALAAAGRGGEHHVCFSDELEDRLLLRLVQRPPRALRPGGDRVERGTRLERGGHGAHEGGHTLQSVSAR